MSDLTGRFVITDEQLRHRDRTGIWVYVLDKSGNRTPVRELAEESNSDWIVFSAGDRLLSTVWLEDVVYASPAADAAAFLAGVSSLLVGAKQEVQPDGSVIVTGTTGDGKPVDPIKVPSDATAPVAVAAVAPDSMALALTRAISDGQSAESRRRTAEARLAAVQVELAAAREPAEVTGSAEPEQAAADPLAAATRMIADLRRELDRAHSTADAYGVMLDGLAVKLSLRDAAVADLSAALAAANDAAVPVAERTEP